MQGCFVFGNDHDTTDAFDRDRRSSRSTPPSTCRALRSSRRSRARRCITRLDREGRILTKNWELYDGQHVVFQPQADDAARSCRRATSGRGARSTRTARSSAGWRRRARSCRSPSWPTSATATTRTISRRITPAIGRSASGRPPDAPDAGASRGRAPAGRQLHAHLADGAAADRACSPRSRPKDVEIAFHDDRMEPIPFDQPADLVAIPVETYTAKRAYQIASEYRRRGVPGGDGRLPRHA